MGLDIYAGTLTRYYSHNWKTVVQQWAEENGYSFNRITPDGEPADDEELSPTDVQAAVENWRDQILAAISQPDQPPYAPWPEDNEKPYYTDKPDWDAFGAMLLVAACRTYEEPVPPTVEKDWIFGEHPLIARLASDEERVWSLFRGVTWWLPPRRRHGRRHRKSTRRPPRHRSPRARHRGEARRAGWFRKPPCPCRRRWRRRGPSKGRSVRGR